MDCDDLTYNIKGYCNITSWLSEIPFKRRNAQRTYLFVVQAMVTRTDFDSTTQATLHPKRGCNATQFSVCGDD